MSLRVRWYNRLAAWLYPVIADPLARLASPAWAAEADIEDMWQAEIERQGELDEIASQAYNDGWADGARAQAEYDGEVPF